MSSIDSSYSEIQTNADVKRLDIDRSSPSLSEMSAITVESSSIELNDEEHRLNFQLRSFIKDKHPKKIWAIEFNNNLKSDQPKIFAALGGPQLSIYECSEEGNIKFLMGFVDPDPNEDFWACCWSINLVAMRSNLLIAGGKRGVIRIIEPESPQIDANTAKHLIGHGAAINQLKIAPHKPYLLASASSDRSIRLWNIQTNVCIATFHGENGHRDEVVAIDFNRDGTKLVSGGMDHLMAIWDLSDKTVANAIDMSRSYEKKNEQHSFKTVLHSYPIFRSRQVHIHYIDCVQWMNEFILSKSNLNDLHCWSPDLRPRKGKIGTKAEDHFKVIAEFNVENCSYYFMRFATDAARSLMALGSDNGEVYVWDLRTTDPTDIPVEILKHPKRTGIIARHVSLSRSGNDLVVCCDDGSIWYYQRQKKNE